MADDHRELQITRSCKLCPILKPLGKIEEMLCTGWAKYFFFY